MKIVPLAKIMQRVFLFLNTLLCTVCDLLSVFKNGWCVRAILFLLLTCSYSVTASEQVVSEEQLAALMARFKTQPDTVVVELTQLVDKHPKWHRGRLELARFQYSIGQFEQAEANMQRVRDSAKLPPKVQRNIDTYLKKIASAKAAKGKIEQGATRHRTSLELNLGSEYLNYLDGYRFNYATKRVNVTSAGNSGESISFKNRFYVSSKEYSNRDLTVNTLSSKLRINYKLKPKIEWSNQLGFEYEQIESERTFGKLSLKSGFDYKIDQGTVNLSASMSYYDRIGEETDSTRREMGVELTYIKLLNKKTRFGVSSALKHLDYPVENYSTNKFNSKFKIERLLSEKLRLTAEYEYIHYRQQKQVINGVNRFGRVIIQNGDLIARYKVNKQLSLDLGLRYLNVNSMNDYSQERIESKLIWAFD